MSILNTFVAGTYWRGFGSSEAGDNLGKLKSEGKVTLMAKNVECYEKIKNSPSLKTFQPRFHEGITDEILCSTALDTARHFFFNDMSSLIVDKA